MFKNANLLTIKCVTPVHAGTGRALGFIDMPIQKEYHTGIPKIEGSTIKGSMRSLYSKKDNDNLNELFGSEDGNSNASIIGFSDAKLLFYPVITLDGIFAYVTCPYLINEYLEIKSIVQKTDKTDKSDCNGMDDILEGKFILLNKSDIKPKLKSIVLDEYKFNISKDYKEININFEKFDLKKDKYVIAISDSDFMEMITLCKEIVRRNRIDEKTGTVIDGALFTEEYLPAESVLYSLVLQNYIEDKKNLYRNYIKSFPNICQIGGNFTIGKGIVKMKVEGDK